MTDVEETPAFSDASKTLTVAEHTKSDTDIHRNVGSPVTAKDSDGEIHLTYSLSGTDAGYFTIVPATGQIKTMKKLDYETKKSFRVVVTATDPTDRSDTINITIEVDDVAEAPVIVPDGISVSGETDVDYNENSDTAVGTYEAAGPEAASARWTLEGADDGLFMVAPTSGTSTTLRFKNSPNFEMAADVGRNNVYEVTVKAAAGGETDTVDVAITVDNVEEDGAIALSPPSPEVDLEVTATLSDPDGSISKVTWTWQTSSDDATWSTATGEATDAVTTSTYTPVEADTDRYLRATASYTDELASGNSAESASAMVVAADTNVAPEFPSGASTTRSIAENTAANTDIGIPVAATDRNGDTLVYSLEGTNAASFGIDSGTGQLSTSAALDYETKDTYSVVVKATDPDGLSGTIDVTINVTDVVDEAPTVVERYAGDDGRIDLDELFKAIDDFFDVNIPFSLDDLFAVIDAFFSPTNG